MAKKTFIIITSLALGLSVLQIIAPSVALGYFDANGNEQVGPPTDAGLVDCGRTGTAQQQAQSCNFAAAVRMINTLINYLIMISMPLAAIAFAYAGWLYLSAGDNSGQVTKARAIFLDVGIGVVIVLSGWLLFKLIETTFLSSDYLGKTYLN